MVPITACVAMAEDHMVTTLDYISSYYYQVAGMCLAHVTQNTMHAFYM